MKKVLTVLFLICAAFGAAAVENVNRLMKLRWELNPAAEAVAFYTVHVTGPVSTNVQVFAPPVELKNIFRDFPNGEYTLTITATGESAETSEHSAPLFVFWYGNTPSAPTNLVVFFPPQN
jgi:hypothetical protein